MGNRPINRRPFRRPPWRRSRRPASWHDCNSTGDFSIATSTGGAPWSQLADPVAGVPSLSTREILVGDIDALYLDKEEVRVDRIVGDVRFFTASAFSLGSVALPPVVRFGLVLEEDSVIEQAGSPALTTAQSAYNLWLPGDLERVEWMYLEQPEPHVSLLNDPATDSFRIYEFHSHLDIRVKRKLGKADRFWLVMSFANALDTNVQATNNWQGVYYSYMLRSVLVS